MRGQRWTELVWGSMLGLVGSSRPGAKRFKWGSVGHDGRIAEEAVLAGGGMRIDDTGHDRGGSGSGKKG